MKKLLLALALGAGVAAAAQAQNEVYVSYGGYTQMDAMDMSKGMKTDNAWGALNAGVNFKVGRNLWLGPSYTFSSQEAKHYDDSHAYYHVIMLNGKYQYYRRGAFSMYAKAGVGVDITHLSINDGDHTKNKAYFAFQVNPVGAQYSLSNAFDVFGELGFGAQGLLQVGFKYKF